MQTRLPWVPNYKNTIGQHSSQSDLISCPLPSYSLLYPNPADFKRPVENLDFFCHFPNAPVSFTTGPSHAKSFSVLSFKRCPWELWRDTIDQVLSQGSWLTLTSVGCRHELHRQSINLCVSTNYKDCWKAEYIRWCTFSRESLSLRPVRST